jgi:hypothetical protein
MGFGLSRAQGTGESTKVIVYRGTQMIGYETERFLHILTIMAYVKVCNILLFINDLEDIRAVKV